MGSLHPNVSPWLKRNEKNILLIDRRSDIMIAFARGFGG
jgi:hypothetical protein